MTSIQHAYDLAREQYAEAGVDTEVALKHLAGVSLSLHCWQGDDVAGFEGGGLTDGGILATGNYPGRARNADELRQDVEMVLSLVPGRHRFNLHAMYLEADGPVPDRNEIEPAHFARWIDWARLRGLGLDFNPTFFSHPQSAGGFTLASRDPDVRRFWIEHAIACRRIGASIGQALETPCVTNVWIPDGMKDATVDRLRPRERLRESLDTIFEQHYDPQQLLDCVEAKLFGIGSEAYVVGSHEFYLAYALEKGVMLCLDSGHFHPTESIADKISSVMLWSQRLMLHVSRGLRWDSDHVVILSDDVVAMMQEVVRGGFLDRVHIGLDFFDASINRVAAWAIGARSTLQALLIAMLEPIERLREFEAAGDYTRRLAWLERSKTLPWSAVWACHCERWNVPNEGEWIDAPLRYEQQVLSKRALWPATQS